MGEMKILLWQSYKSKVGTIMNYQFYTHFEIKISYIKSGMGNKQQTLSLTAIFKAPRSKKNLPRLLSLNYVYMTYNHPRNVYD